MLIRFCLYSVLKNLRFFEPFFIVYLRLGLHLSFLQIGTLIGYQKLLTGILEIPSGVAVDRFGRCRGLAVCFLCYVFAFPLFALAVDSEMSLLLLYAGQTFFGLGEALRTGSHKAVMLDWVDSTGQPDQATRVISVTRMYSKTAAGVSALAAGFILFFTEDFAWLFWAAALPAGLGALLMLSYPKYLEGESVRSGKDKDKPTWKQQWKNLWAVPITTVLLLQSMLFESQVKLIQMYIQPFLLKGIDDYKLATIGGIGAIIIGVYYLVQDGFSGISSLAAMRVEKMCKGRRSAMKMIFAAAMVSTALVCASLYWDVWIVGILGLVLLAGLQSCRRPIFVTELNQHMDKSQRATTLSIESQGRTWAYALSAPISGWAADQFGMLLVFLFAMVLLAVCRILPIGKDKGQHH